MGRPLPAGITAERVEDPIPGSEAARGASRDAGCSQRLLQDEESVMGAERPQSETLRAGLIPHRWTRVDDPATVAVVAAHETVIAGGGPAGLTAAYELSKHGQSCVVLEADPRMVGGISRTDQYKGYRFDIGGHRFFSKSDEVNRLWREILGDEFLTRVAAEPDLLRPQVLPLSAQARRRAARSSGSCARAGSSLSYLKAQAAADPARAERRGLGRQPLRPRCSSRSSSRRTPRRSGGCRPTTISADWAAQRIKDLSLVRAVTSAPLRRPSRRARAR